MAGGQHDEMRARASIAAELRRQGIGRREFLQFCASLATMMALPAGAAEKIAAALSTARRPSVIWLSFQECTGCTESLTRSHSPSIENLIFDLISLDYHHTLQAAAGAAAEQAREAAMKAAAGNPGAYEAALKGHAVHDDKQPLEILRTIHSFDPCIACAVHVLEL